MSQLNCMVVAEDCAYTLLLKLGGGWVFVGAELDILFYQ